MKKFEVEQMDASDTIVTRTIVDAIDVWEATCLVMLDHYRYPETVWISVKLHVEGG